MTSVRLCVDGQELAAPDGATLAGVLIRSGVWRTRTHLVTDEPRGPFCGMGVCFECELTVDGKPAVRSCLVRVREGMQVQTDA